MSALTGIRDTREILCGATSVSRKVEPASNTVVYTGSITAINASGKAVPASDTAGLTAAGICEGTVDGNVCIRSGVFVMENGTGSEALTVSDIGKVVYVLDDQTVGKIGGTNRIAAGVLRAITENGVAVELGNGPAAGAVALPTVVSQDPAAASTGNFGNLIVVGTSWTGGTAISAGTAGEIYMSNGTSWVKLG